MLSSLKRLRSHPCRSTATRTNPIRPAADRFPTFFSKIVERLFLAKIRPPTCRFMAVSIRGNRLSFCFTRRNCNICEAADTDQTNPLVAVDMSAAFNINRLSIAFGIKDAALQRLTSYLDRRSLFVRHGSGQSATTCLEIGLLQGSSLGPLLFALYILPLANHRLKEVNHHQYHEYADDINTFIGQHLSSWLMQLLVFRHIRTLIVFRASRTL